ncbi:MAG: hypothetical protein ACR9NN_12170 [Nostochopsis sp.]
MIQATSSQLLVANLVKPLAISRQLLGILGADTSELSAETWCFQCKGLIFRAFTNLIINQ